VPVGADVVVELLQPARSAIVVTSAPTARNRGVRIWALLPAVSRGCSD
jgi:hypothetical protein